MAVFGSSLGIWEEEKCGKQDYKMAQEKFHTGGGKGHLAAGEGVRRRVVSIITAQGRNRGKMGGEMQLAKGPLKSHTERKG